MSGRCFWEKTSNGCKNDDDIFRQKDAYDFYAVCRADNHKEAEFQCDETPAKLNAKACKDREEEPSYYDAGIGGGDPEGQFFPFGATTTTAVVDDSTLNQQKSVISVGVAVVSSSVAVVLIAAIVAGTVLIVISRSRKRVERDNDAPKDSAPSSLLLFEGVVDYGARRCHLDCESTVDL